MEERPGPFVLGDRVEARLRGKSHWYPAEVVKVEAEATDDDDCTSMLRAHAFVCRLAEQPNILMAVKITTNLRTPQSSITHERVLFTNNHLSFIVQGTTQSATRTGTATFTTHHHQPPNSSTTCHRAKCAN